MEVLGIGRVAPETRIVGAGYALIALAGLLKFYPMVALIITNRERPLIFAAIALAVIAALAAFVSVFSAGFGRSRQRRCVKFDAANASWVIDAVRRASSASKACFRGVRTA
jgi:hypothetical protein